MNPAPNLFFVGPMGAGKTTVGRQTAELLGLPFHDLDHEIEAHTGASVKLIFDVEGECGFRNRESALLVELAARSGIVLATGGGAVLREENRRVLKSRGFVIWLDTGVDAQLARLARDRQRPLLGGGPVAATMPAAPDRRERLESLAVERNPLYRETADLVLPSSGLGNSAVMARRLIGLLATQWQHGEARNAVA